MPPNRKTRRTTPKEPTMEQRMIAAATSAPPPIVINLDNCRIVVRDIQSNHGAAKELLFLHASGGVVFRAVIAPQLARELTTLLSAPSGLVIAPSADTPAA